MQHFWLLQSHTVKHQTIQGMSSPLHRAAASYVTEWGFLPSRCCKLGHYTSSSRYASPERIPNAHEESVCRPFDVNWIPLLPVATYVKISWAPGLFAKLTRNGLVSIDKKAMEIKRMTKSYSLHQCGATAPAAMRVTARTRSPGEDVPDFGAVPPQQSTTHRLEPMMEEKKEASPGADGVVERLHVADVEAWDWVSVRATRGFTALDGKHSVEMEVTPVGTKRRRPASSSKRSGSEDRNSLRCISQEVLASVAICALCGDPPLQEGRSFLAARDPQHTRSCACHI